MNKYNGFIINLDRRENRLMNAMDTLNKTNINIKRYSAIDGLQINIDDELKKRINPWNLNKKNISNENKLRGILGCCLSHLNLWNKISKMEDEYVFVFEDDLCFSNSNIDFIKEWTKINNILPEDFGLLWLNNPHKFKKTNNISKNKIIKTTESRTTEAYIIKPSFAKELYNFINNNLGAVDAHMEQYSNFLNKKNKNIFYKLMNGIFCQTSKFKSDIQN